MSKKLFVLLFCTLVLTGCMENKMTPEEENKTEPTAEETAPAVTQPEETEATTPVTEDTTADTAVNQ